MNPPPIGEALDAAWTVFKKDYAAILVGTLCALLLGLIPFVGGGLAMAGLIRVSLKALRGQTPEPEDGFIGQTLLPTPCGRRRRSGWQPDR